MVSNLTTANVSAPPFSLPGAMPALSTAQPLAMPTMSPTKPAAASGDLFSLLAMVMPGLRLGMPALGNGALPFASTGFPAAGQPFRQAPQGLPPQPLPAPSASLGTPAPGGRPPRIAQIDDFTTDNTGFNHGAEVAKTLNPDGKTNLLQMNIGGGGDRLTHISNALDNVIARVKKGETIDAVNLSQQDFSNGPQAAQIRAKIDQLSTLGVPVAVAAGNNGPNQHNDLISNKAFSVESTTNGQVNSDSGIGNVQAEGRTTSFATANFARQIALKHAAGQRVIA
jgi:hypothetical protein